MKICAIDIGTNSVLYLLACIDKHGSYTPEYFRAKTTKLGESLRPAGFLKQSAQIRTLKTVESFLRHAKKNRASRFVLAGTGALREAENASEFIKKVYDRTKQQIKILSGRKEAEIVSLSVSHFLKPKSKKYIIIDIGGGSTELIFHYGTRHQKIHSFPFGAVNLTEACGDNLSCIENRIKGILHTNIRRQKGILLTGVGGTLTTLCAILKRQKKYNPKKIHGEIISFRALDKTIRKLSKLNLSERKKLIPFDPKRAEIILGGLIILKVIMRLLGADKITVCDRGLVYGLALSKA